MLSFIFEKTAGAIRDTYEVVADTTEYIVEDITSIGDSIEKGWNEGLITTPDNGEDGTEDTPTQDETLHPKSDS